VIVFWILCFFLFMYIVRTLKGPTIWDRLLGLNLIASKVIVIIIVVSSMYELPFLLDFAIIYTLSGFVGVIFLALFFSKSRLERRRKRRGKKS